MPRIIFKCPHIKGGTEQAASHLKNYVEYMSTRKGVDEIDPSEAVLPATKRQRQLAAQLLRDFPLSRGMFEYEDYRTSPTRGNASEFIARALEENYDRMEKRENYIKYIAMRPNAQRVGSHGLFTGSDDHIVLSQVADEVAHHPGVVWLPIISLRREDAARLGYDSAERWKALLSGYATEMAKAMKIPWTDFRWYAAFHNESHHPHVHMVCYSANPSKGFLTKQGIADIKAGLVKEIFRQDLTELYQEQTQRRNELNVDTQAVLRELIGQMHSGTIQNNRIEELMEYLAERLRFLSGKKQYGYLKPPLKAIVDEIVDELAKDPRVASAYELWYKLREEVLRTYKENLPERLPLSRQSEFKRIKNIVIEEAVSLGAQYQVFHPCDQEQDGSESAHKSSSEDRGASSPENKQNNGARADDSANPRRWYWSAIRIFEKAEVTAPELQQALEWLKETAQAGMAQAQYRLGKMLYQGDFVPKDVAQALEWLRKAAIQGHPYAQYALGQIFLSGEDVPRDLHAASEWFQKAANQGNQYAEQALARIDSSANGIAIQAAARLLHHLSIIFRDQSPPSNPGGLVNQVDSKLLRKIKAKKIAQGHKEDDYEPTMTL